MVAKPLKKSVLDAGLSEKTMSEMRASNGGGVLTVKGKNGPPREARGMMKVDVSVEIRAGADALTIEEAKEILGWRVAEENQPFKVKDSHGNRVVFINNSTNRPFRPGLARRYMNEHLRGKWALNGETLIIDRKGKVQSAQHRLVGFILAEETRAKDPKAWERRVGKKPLTMPCIIVRGISDAAEVVNTIDGGQKRTLGDIFYREDRFAFDPSSLGEVKQKVGRLQVVASDKVRQKLCNILAGAVRLVWIRSGGKVVSDAKHFPITEATEFVEANPKIADAVLLLYNLDGGVGMGGQKISKFLTLAYAAGLYYLMSASSTDPDEWQDARRTGVESEVTDFKMEKKARTFWEKFASGAELKADDPIHVLREGLRGVGASSGQGRDEIVGMVIKAFNLWVDGKTAKPKDVQMKKHMEDGMEKLAEDPRLGGIDVEGQEPDEPAARSLGEVEGYDPADDTREGSKAGRKWTEGDTAWVKGQQGVEHYFCTVEEFIKGDGVPDSVIVRDDAGKQWQEDAKQLSLKYPG